MKRKMECVIKLDELRRMVNLIFDHISHDLEVSSINVNKNFYWDFTVEGRYDLDKKPPEINVGSLWDDWQFLASCCSREDAVPPLFMHVAPLLHYIGVNVYHLSEKSDD